LAEEKAAPSEEKKAVTEKKPAKSEVPSPKKPATKKEAKVVAEPEVVPAKEEKAVETKVPAVTKKSEPAEKAEKVAPKVAKPRKELTGNPMLRPRIEKVTINMSVGKSGQPLEQAVTILQELTNQKPSKRVAKKTIRDFGIRKGESIACVVTLRKEKAEQFLKKAFQAVENKLSKYCFDSQGNFSFGIKEHIDIPGTKYVPSLGIHGMDVSVALSRPGYRVKRRHRAKSKVGKDHLLTADEAKLFIKDEFDVEII
jgi:large subunit ribosomal protein L5